MLKAQPNDAATQRPGMCRNCGAIVGAGENQCAVCGAPFSPPTAAQSSPSADRETIRFARAVLNRPHKFTILFLVLNFFLYLLMWQSSGMETAALGAFPPQVLIAYGAKLNFLINEHREWWRLVTPVFLHGSLLHLLVNMYALWMIGPLVEKLYGSAKFVTFWVLTGIAGVAASYFTVVSTSRPLNPIMNFLLKTQDHPSIGASGALFGLVGVLFVFGIKFRNELPAGFKKAFGVGLLPMILLNVVIGYLGRGVIDNAAHMGGLLSGAALAALVDYRRPGERTGVATLWQVLQVASLGILVFSFAKVVQHFRDPLPASLAVRPEQRQHPEDMAPVLRYFLTLNEAHGALVLALNNRDISRLDESLEKLNTLPLFDAQADDLRARLKHLLFRAKAINQMMPSVSNRPAAAMEQERAAIIKDLDQWTADYETWLRTEGRKHGITLAERNFTLPQ